MHIKKIALRAMVLGMVAVAVMATNQPIDWDGPCTDAAIVANWMGIRTRMVVVLSLDDGRISFAKRVQVHLLLRNSFFLPITPDLEILQRVFGIVGADYMQYALGEILNKYWENYPCVTPTPTISSSASSSDSSSSDVSSTSSDSSSSDIYFSSDIYSTISSDSSSSDTYSIISSDSSSSEIYSSLSSDSSSSEVYSTTSSDSSSSYVSSSYTTSTPVNPTSVTSDIYSTSTPYSSAPTSLYSTIPPHKCYIAVVVTSRVITAYTAAY
ncbi:hypothetical protein GGH94_006109 [Coemansia aciculifera]|uniref:Uncharacterized protein n=1 Tax=Coemansia aciculifera TaxID=417176 RepID=A0A9W8IC69_9FUNG|nr:hypothetical protein GGH94_006109 [Coemansia aciculifera]KAJ2869741.1 hypothetical protein GGH93_006071 [Coemansia aciculifera]